MLDLVWVHRGQLIDQADLENVAWLQRESDASIISGTGRAMGTAISCAWSLANLVHPAGWMNWRSARRWLKGNGLHRFSLGYHQQVEHAARAGEYPRLDDGIRPRRLRSNSKHHEQEGRTKCDQQ